MWGNLLSSPLEYFSTCLQVARQSVCRVHFFWISLTDQWEGNNWITVQWLNHLSVSPFLIVILRLNTEVHRETERREIACNFPHDSGASKFGAYRIACYYYIESPDLEGNSYYYSMPTKFHQHQLHIESYTLIMSCAIAWIPLMVSGRDIDW